MNINFDQIKEKIQEIINKIPDRPNSFWTRKRILIGIGVLFIIVIIGSFGEDESSNISRDVQKVSETNVTPNSEKPKIPETDVTTTDSKTNDSYYTITDDDLMIVKKFISQGFDHMKGQLDFNCFTKKILEHLGPKQFKQLVMVSKFSLNPYGFVGYKPTENDRKLLEDTKSVEQFLGNQEKLLSIGLQCKR